jgi:bifunctional NMN adenylyltransferase/nudix hydrolase
MSPQRHTLAVFIGRFQPFHIGHRAVMAHAETFADSALIIVGSAYRARSPKNPLTYPERAQMIETGLHDIALPVATLPLVDTLYDDHAWAANVRAAVALHLRNARLDPAVTQIVLTGYEKDKSSAYVRWFPEWHWNGAPVTTHNGETVSATDLRHALYDAAGSQPGKHLTERFGARHVAAVQAWVGTHPVEVAHLRNEAAFIKQYQTRIKQSEAVHGYPIPANTADAVVVHSGHILLVERGQTPGKGLLALPGGSIDRHETALEAACRELSEECGFDLTAPMLRDTLRDRHVFDHPDRAERGWVRTEAFLFDLQPLPNRPDVRGGDDAAGALWVPVSTLLPDRMFEDHFDIIQTMVPGVPFTFASVLQTHAT